MDEQICGRCGAEQAPNDRYCLGCKAVDLLARDGGWTDDTVEVVLSCSRRSKADARERHQQPVLATPAGGTASPDDQACGRCGSAQLDSDPYCFGCAAADELAREQGMSDDQLQAQLACSRRMHADARENYNASSPENRAALQADVLTDLRRLPAGIPPVGRSIELTGTTINDSQRFPHTVMRLDDEGVFCYDPRTLLPVFNRPWSHVAALAVEGPDTVQSRITVPQRLGLGVLGIGLRKNVTRSWVAVETIGCDLTLFETEKLTAVKLRDRLQPFISWHDRHQPHAIH